MNLFDLGWQDAWGEALRAVADEGAPLVAARVAREEVGLYWLYGEPGEMTGRVSGRFMNRSVVPADFPKVGDWVAVASRPEERTATIHAVLPRRSVLSRKEAFVQTNEQILAANVDLLVIVVGLDGDFNVRRIERYLAVAFAGGIAPVVILNKADLSPDVGGAVAAVGAVAPGTPIHAVSAVDGRGMEAVASHLTRGTTACFLGSSGVGKSTLVNRLLGEERQATATVRDWDSKGRHTTTRRELIPLPGGGVVIDSPGIREMQVWAGQDEVDTAFADIAALAAACRFRDCSHAVEPGCAVLAALEAGTLDRGRYESFGKLQREAARLEFLKSVKARRLEKALARRSRKGREDG